MLHANSFLYRCDPIKVSTEFVFHSIKHFIPSAAIIINVNFGLKLYLASSSLNSALKCKFSKMFPNPLSILIYTTTIFLFTLVTL